MNAPRIHVGVDSRGVVVTTEGFPSAAELTRALLREACKVADTPAAVAATLGVSVRQLRRLARRHRVALPGGRR